MEERRGVYKILVGKPEGMRSLGRPTRKWEDNIKISLQKVGYESMEWIDVARDRDRCRAIVNAVISIWVP